MAFGDKTGPRGEGPRTGRGAGGCTDDDVKKAKKNPNPGTVSPGRGQGRGPIGGGFGQGSGRGFGRGMGRGWRAPGAGYVANQQPADDDEKKD